METKVPIRNEIVISDIEVEERFCELLDLLEAPTHPGEMKSELPGIFLKPSGPADNGNKGEDADPDRPAPGGGTKKNGGGK